jgi:DNA-binding NarL/FixJ family response regulator
MTAQRRIRVLCADDHRIVRDGLTVLIDQQPDMAVVGVAESGEEAVKLFLRLRPDITILDMQMSPMTGVDAIRAIREADAHARIIVLTMYVGDEDIHQAVSAGAAAYLFKNTAASDLIGVIREVYLGHRPAADVDLTTRLQERSGRSRLTPREAQVLELISHGLRDREIAAAMEISEHTVSVHVKNILAKLEVRDRTAAVRAALTRGIIHIS